MPRVKVFIPREDRDQSVRDRLAGDLGAHGNAGNDHSRVGYRFALTATRVEARQLRRPTNLHERPDDPALPRKTPRLIRLASQGSGSASVVDVRSASCQAALIRHGSEAVSPRVAVSAKRSCSDLLDSLIDGRLVARHETTCNRLRSLPKISPRGLKCVWRSTI
jgi:hypothetical protein